MRPFLGQVGGARDTFAALARWGLDLVLPPSCLGCRVAIDRPGLCASCWRRLTFLAPPWCACCGLPFEQTLEQGAICGGCAGAPPEFDRARAALAYDDTSRPLLLAFKHGDRLEGVAIFAAWLAAVLRDRLDEIDLIAPVPLHRWRLWSRRYNQAAELARALGRRTGLACDPRLLLRKRATPSQGGLSAAGRRRNVAGAFALRHGADIAGRRVLLVDDVFTTGATLDACARALRRAGAARVECVALARVIRS
ncbi:MAG: amidophosphoribosyltransferase [Rhodospirillales bacterium]|nr:amidophosphoribosyltransferase [Rhodospirillales bacterium]